MPLSIDDVITATTAAQVEQEILDLCATGGLPTTAWQAGGVIRELIAIISQEIATKSQVEIQIARGMLGDLTSSAWAKIWAQSIYNVLFVPASSATGFVTLTNAAAVNYPLNPGDLIVANTSTGYTYRNQAAITIPAGGTLSSVAIASDQIGTVANAAPGAITTMVSTLVGVTVTNPLAVLGADEETTTALVARARNKLGSLSPNGPRSAYDYVATTPLNKFPAVAGVTLTPTSAPITRSKTTGSTSTGVVSVYIANASGAPSSGDIALVQTAINTWAEPWCVTATVAAATNVVIPITYQIWLKSSMTSASVQTLVANALGTYFSSIPVGGFTGDGAAAPNGAVYLDEIQSIIHDAVPNVQRVLLTAPSADVTVTPSQVPVLGTITPTVYFV